MGEILVTANEIKSKAGELRDYNGKFKTEVGLLDSQENTLVGMWEGEARNKFDEVFKRDKGQFDEFYNLIEQYCQALETIAMKYEQAEQTNYETASQRTYH